VNFPAIYEESDTIDLNTIESNDIACVLRVYGVEAARGNIVKEMDSVFQGLLLTPDFFLTQ
jgi:DNA-directed RNA polymerase I subunit RPA1